MKVVNLSEDSHVYTSNVYLVTGLWNVLADRNTLIDVGRDPTVIDKILGASTGVGKQRIEQVVLTHSHYDHASLLPVIRDLFHPTVYAYSASLAGVDHRLKDGDTLKIGDRMFEVIHTPGHSSDSVCLYCEEEGALFVGDAPVVIRFPNGTYEDDFIRALEKLCRRDVRSIYFGHGDPIFSQCNDLVRRSMKLAHGGHSDNN